MHLLGLHLRGFMKKKKSLQILKRITLPIYHHTVTA